MPLLGLPMSKWGSGHGALLEAQHLVKGPQGLGCYPVVFLGGEGRGSYGFWAPGREGKVRV